jgi:hypothetical protein
MFDRKIGLTDSAAMALDEAQQAHSAARSELRTRMRMLLTKDIGISFLI